MHTSSGARLCRVLSSLGRGRERDPSEVNFKQLIESHIKLCGLMSFDDDGPSKDLKKAVEEAMHYAIE